MMTYKFRSAAVAVTAAALLAAAPPAMARDHHHHHHHHRHHYHGNVGAGIAGFAAGAIIGGALASHAQQRPDYYDYQPRPSYGRGVRWCMHHYRSYDPRSETYLGYDGHRHHCP